MPNSISRRTLLAGIAGGLTALHVPSTVWAKHGPATGLVHLNYNENPYGPSAKALEAAKQAADFGAFYGDSLQSQLRAAIADRQGLNTSNVVISTGSNEALCAATAAWANNGHVLAPQLTYSAHLNYARRTGRQVVTVPIRADMSIDLNAMAAAVNEETTLVYICNPNNPTGLTIDGDELRDFCRSVGKQAVVLIDEAYNELTEKPSYTSMIDLVHAEENVVIAKTFSKVYGLAGLRVGYALGRTDLIKSLREHVMSWPNAVGLAAALASHNDAEFLAFSKEKIAEGRRIVTGTLKRHGLKPLHSETNFVYTDIGRDAGQFAAQMRERGVVIGRVYAPYSNWSRVSMGKVEDVQTFANVFDEIYPS